MYKRSVLVFLIISLFNIFVINSQNIIDKNLLEDSFNASSEMLFAQGSISSKKGIDSFKIYRTKNRDGFFDLSIKINEDLYQLSAKKTNDISYKNNSKMEDNNYFYDSLPLDLLNYGFRNVDFKILEKSSVFKYKGLNADKILVTEKEEVIEAPTIEENTTSDEIPSIEENTIEDSEIVNETSTFLDLSKSQDSSLINNNKEENSYPLTPLTPSIITQPKEDKVVYEPAKYKKIVLYLGEDNNLILRKEFYSNITDREPKYIVEANSINFINGFYIIVEYNISDIENNRDYILKYNTQTLDFSDNELVGTDRRMSNFYGVK